MFFLWAGDGLGLGGLRGRWECLFYLLCWGDNDDDDHEADALKGMRMQNIWIHTHLFAGVRSPSDIFGFVFQLPYALVLWLSNDPDQTSTKTDLPCIDKNYDALSPSLSAYPFDVGLFKINDSHCWAGSGRVWSDSDGLVLARIYIHICVYMILFMYEWYSRVATEQKQKNAGLQQCNNDDDENGTAAGLNVTQTNF